MAERIDDYAIIGNGRSAALITKSGSIDWLCWPSFGSDALFGRLLDPRAGHWTVSVAGVVDSTHRYVHETNVLVTTFDAPRGELVVRDAMPVPSKAALESVVVAEQEVLRELECVVGTVQVDMVFDAQPGFGRKRKKVRSHGRLAIGIEYGSQLVVLRGERPMTIDDDGTIRSSFELRAGDRVLFSMAYSAEAPAVLAPLGPEGHQRLLDTLTFWRAWARKTKYDGPYRDHVVRSALTLRLLIYSPSGAMIAAPTTSLPERLGGDLNWDYRYCWLRDASFTARALIGLGHEAEAEAFVAWLLHTTAITLPELRVVYDVYGRVVKKECELGHLAGYEGSRPVRIGNAAGRQVQNDVYGEVLEAAALLLSNRGPADRDTQKMLKKCGEWVFRNWRNPDSGIWEPRYEPRRHTHSLLLCWDALDTLLTLHAKGVIEKLPVAKYTAARDEMAHVLRTGCWSEDVGAYMQSIGSDMIDSTAILCCWYGFEKPTSARMQGTWQAIKTRLEDEHGLFFRYEQSRKAGEGAFGLSAFWMAEFLARGGGSLEEATDQFARLLHHANGVGLYAEEQDPVTRLALGNFPQAFTHVGLINAALSLCERLKREAGVPVAPPATRDPKPAAMEAS